MEIECTKEPEFVPADRRIYATYGGCLHKERYLQSIIICPKSHALMLRVIASTEVGELKWIALHCSSTSIDSPYQQHDDGVHLKTAAILKAMTSQPIQVD